MDKKTILVTGIGGNVGQGIIRNLKNTEYSFKIVGTNVYNFSAGNHLCDSFYLVPFADHPDYIKTISKIIEDEQIDLILPSTDLEVYYLSLNKNNLSCKIVCSESSSAKRYLDKYLSYCYHQEQQLPFAKSCLPSEYQGQFKNIIAKPRAGRGSRGIEINPKDLSIFSDEEYLIQELHQGKEITTAFYVTKQQELLGQITLARSLSNGMTSECIVDFNHNDKINEILIKLIKANQFYGSINLQAIVNEQQEIIPFEINCRISGTNSIRANFGFQDIKYAVQEYLFNQTPSTPEIIPGIATRIMMDVIYPHQSSFETCRDNQTKSYLY